MKLVYLPGHDSADRLTRDFTTSKGVVAHRTGVIDPRNEAEIDSLNPPAGGKKFLERIGSVWADGMKLEVTGKDTVRITVSSLNDWATIYELQNLSGRGGRKG